jgi:hypothetical protein
MVNGVVELLLILAGLVRNYARALMHRTNGFTLFVFPP